MTRGDAPGERRPATLELLYDGDVVFVQADEAVVGRTAKCTVRVVHPLVSREHCRIEARADGVFVADLDSVNGTWLNGARTDGRTQVRSGDKIGLGRDGAVLVVRRAVVDGVDVSRLRREEDVQTMISGDPRAAGAVARIEVASDALPSLGAADEPTTRALVEATKRDETREAAPRPPIAQTMPVAPPVGASTTAAVPAVTTEVAPAAPPAPRRRGFAPGFVVGLLLGLALVAATAKFTRALDGIRARAAHGGGR